MSGAGTGSVPVGKAKPAAGEPMLPAAAIGGPTRTSASMGSLPPKRMGVYAVSPGVMAAKLISAPAPEYPKLAGLIHMEGQVTLRAMVSRDGKVVATHVLQGHRLLRGAASNAVRQWRYRPYLVDGQPADVATIVTVNFRRR
jgi:TonB family protein